VRPARGLNRKGKTMTLHRTSGSAAVRDVERQGEDVARAPQFEWLARAGLAARGAVYAVIGILALKLALGDGGKATNQQGALKTIADRPFGKTLLVLVAIGLAGYAIWRLVRAALGHGPEQSDDTQDRIAGLASGIAYAILCVTAVKILIGASTGSGTPKEATGGVLDWTGGPLLVGMAGVVLIGVAGYQAHKGLKKKFLENSKTEQMSEKVQRLFTALGVFGHVARAVVFALIGYGLIKAAIDYDPDKAVGLDGALLKLANASYGPWLLGVVAAGLIGFAAYSVADARYRRV
jgi:hypothetical protein